MVWPAVIGFGLLLAQAEPAPAEAPPAAAPLPTPHAVAVFGKLAYREESGARPGPSFGFSVGLSYARRYAIPGQAPNFQTAVGLDLFHDQFSTNVTGSAQVTPGMETLFEGQRQLTQTSFAATHTMAVPVSRMRFWLAAGAGMSIGHFSTPEAELRPGDNTAALPLLRGTFGVDVTVRQATGVSVRGDYTMMLRRPTFTTTAGQTMNLFGDLMNVGVGVFHRF